MSPKIKSLNEVTIFFAALGACVTREPHPTVPVVFIAALSQMHIIKERMGIKWAEGVQFTPASFKIQMPREDPLDVWLITPGDWMQSKDWAEWDEATPAERFFFFKLPEKRDVESWFWVKKEVQARCSRKLDVRAEAWLEQAQKDFEKDVQVLGL